MSYQPRGTWTLCCDQAYDAYPFPCPVHGEHNEREIPAARQPGKPDKLASTGETDRP